MVLVDGGDPPSPGGRRRRARGKEVDDLSGLAGSAGRSVTAQWSVNSAQSPAYAARVRADNTRADNTRAGASVAVSVAVVMAG